MKHTKRLFSVLLTLCLLLGILPTTVWASHPAKITQQPTTENNYTVRAHVGSDEVTEGFQWWKKISVPETYNLVESNPAENELGVDFVYTDEGSYADGHWVADRDVLSPAPIYRVSIDYITSPGDQVTVRIPSEMVNDTLTVKNGSGDSFQKMSDGVYTATFDDDGGIRIKSDSEFTAVITVDRYWTAMEGETNPSLSTREPGSYYCVVSHESGDLMSNIVTLVSPEDQPTVDWLADTNNHMLVLGPVVVTADNYDDIFRGVPEAVASGTASFKVVNGTPTLTLDGVNVTEGYPLDIIEVGLLCSDDLTIVLADGSDNKITVSSDGIAMGIMTGDLSYFPPVTVTGAGTLTVSPSASASDSNNMCFGVYAGGIHVTGGAEFTVTAVHDDEEACFGLTIGSEEDLKVSDGGVVRISSMGTAIAFNESASDIDADGYSIQGSTTANDFTNLADADAVLKEVDGSTGKIFVLTVNDELAKSVVIAPAHSHTWAGAWATNDTHHWHECTAAGCPITDDAGKDSYAAHAGGTATCTDKAVCDTCGSPYGELAGHDFTGDYLSDADGHWHQCKNCTATDSKAAHTYDDDQDDTCNDCGYTRTSTQPTFAISGTVTDNSDAAVSGAVVKLMQGSRQISQAATDSNGQYSFANVPAGTYNVVAEQGGGADKITKTILVVLTDSNATEKNIKMPDGQKNSVVEVKGTDTPAVVAGGVDQVAEAQSVSPGETVTVKLTVEKKTESAAAGAADIKQVASGKTLEFLDLSLVKEVTGGFGTNVTNITNTGGSVLEIVVPYDFTDKNNVTVYRHHNGAAEALTPAETGAGGTFKLSADSVIIYATKFSTYAIGYTASGGGTPDPTPPTPPSGGGSSGGSSSPATYTPVIEKSDHGKVKCTPQSPERGDKVTVTLTPDKGWQIDGLTVTDRNGKPVAVTNRGGGIYTFTQPTGRVTIKASFKPISNAVSGCSKDETCPIWSYEDASLSAWYHDGVHYCLERGLMVGTDSTHFSPGMTASRAMIASILWRMEGEPEAKTTQPFSDVADGRWYTRAVAWAAEAGVIKGYGEGRFGPNDPITREQLASILWRYAGSPPASDLPLNFTDAGEASGYARDALRWAVEQGILTGKGGGVLDPRGKASRAEVAQMLTRFCLNGK